MKISTEDLGTLVICSTRYAQQSGKDGENKKIIKLISEKYLDKQSYKTLSVLDNDERFYLGWPAYTSTSVWKNWYIKVREEKKKLIIKFVDENIDNNKLTNEYLNDSRYYMYLTEVKGLKNVVTEEDIRYCMDKYHVYSEIIGMTYKLSKEQNKKLQHDYINYCLKNKVEYWACLNSKAFEDWYLNKLNTITTVTKSDFSWLSMYSIRYSMGRMTYMPSLVVEDIVTPNIENVTTEVLKYMLKDTEKQAERDNYGSRWDKPMWLEWVETIKKELNKRNH